MPEPTTPAGGAEADLLARQFRQHAGKMSRQASVFLGGTVFLVFGGYLFKIYVSRQIGAEGLGLYALGMTTVGFFGLFATLGLPETVARFVAIYRGAGEVVKIRRLVRRSLLTILASSSLLAALIIAFRHGIADRFYQEPELARYLPLFALVLMFNALTTFLGQVLRGLQEVARRTVINHFVAFPAKVVTTVGLFALGWALTAYVVAEIVSILLAVVLLAVAARREIWKVFAAHPAVESRQATTPHDTREEWSYARSMVGLGFLAFVVGRLDVVVLGAYLPADQVGIYSIAVTTSAFVPTLLRSLNSIFGPMIADLHARQQTSLLERLFQTSTKWCLGLTWPLVVVIVLFGRELMGIFGPEFTVGAPVLALLAAGQLINVGVGSVGHLLVMSGHQRLEVWGVAVTAALTLPLNLVLIPRWGMLGAAIALTVGLTASNLLRAWLVWDRLRLVPYNRRALRFLGPAVASLIASLAAWGWIRPEVSFWAMLGALAAAYAAFLGAALFALDPDDRLILRAVKERLVPGRSR